MKQLWAPWRVEYITGEKPKGCIFCKDALDTEGEGLVLYRGPISTVILNKYPYNNGHLLIAPLRHLGALKDLSQDESGDLFRLLTKSTMIIEEAMNPDGFNIGMNLGRGAGAGVEDHVHFHVVPRWSGDVNFMPIAAEVRVIPEHLTETARKLRPAFAKL
jgi:ATP adenylyltransferase